MPAIIRRLEVAFIESVETTLGRADRLNSYATHTGDPAFIVKDAARYASVTPATVQEAIRRYLHDKRVLLSVVPKGQQELALR